MWYANYVTEWVNDGETKTPSLFLDLPIGVVAWDITSQASEDLPTDPNCVTVRVQSPLEDYLDDLAAMGHIEIPGTREEVTGDAT